MLDYYEALARIEHHSKSFGTEMISIEDALNRVLAKEIVADRDYPPFNRASMDGYAIRYEDLIDGIREFTVLENIYAGQSTYQNISKGQCFKIMTGAAVPSSADVVIRVEDSLQITKNKVELSVTNAKSYLNIAKKGEDYYTNQKILTIGTIITAVEWAILAVLGKHKVEVFKLPTIAIVSTGNEIKQVHEPVSEVQIRDSNSFTIKAIFKKYTISPKAIFHIKDDCKELENAILSALNNDIVILSGGVSAGDADFVPQILIKTGVKEIFHKVNIKPGKPIWFGITDKEKIVFALPGNPFSVQVACKIFIEPFLRKCFFVNDSLILKMPFSGYREKKNSLDEFLPVRFSKADFGLEIAHFNGSGDISAAKDTIGIICHPKGRAKLVAGNEVDFYSW